MNLLLYKIINYAERKSDEDTCVVSYCQQEHRRDFILRVH